MRNAHERMEKFAHEQNGVLATSIVPMNENSDPWIERNLPRICKKPLLVLILFLFFDILDCAKIGHRTREERIVLQHQSPPGFLPHIQNALENQHLFSTQTM